VGAGILETPVFPNRALVSLIQIDLGYQRWRMKDGSGEFQAKKTPGGGWYYLVLSDGQKLRHTADVIERLAEPNPVVGANMKVCPNCNGSTWGVRDPWGRQQPCINCNGIGKVEAKG